jgi:hypothetical protein
MPALPSGCQTLAQLEEQNKTTPQNLSKDLIIGIWKYIANVAKPHSQQACMELEDIVEAFVKICKSDPKTSNIAGRFETTAKSKSLGGVDCHIWNIDPSMEEPNQREKPNQRKEPSQWEEWVSQLVSAALQNPRFVENEDPNTDEYKKQVSKIFEDAAGENFKRQEDFERAFRLATSTTVRVISVDNSAE